MHTFFSGAAEIGAFLWRHAFEFFTLALLLLNILGNLLFRRRLRLFELFLLRDQRSDIELRWGPGRDRLLSRLLLEDNLLNGVKERQMDPILIVSAISGILQAVQTWIAVRDQKQATAAFDRGIKSGPSDVNVLAAAAQLSSLAPPSIIDAYGQRLQKCWTTYETMIRAPDGSYMPPEIDDATVAVKRCICRELARLKSINGSFPPGKLADWWNEYGCA